MHPLAAAAFWPWANMESRTFSANACMFPMSGQCPRIGQTVEGGSCRFFVSMAAMLKPDRPLGTPWGRSLPRFAMHPPPPASR